MCMFSSPIEHVSGTRIFARMLDGSSPTQALIYAMKLAAVDDVAMILAVPTPPGASEQALRFVSLERYAELFDVLDAQFPGLMQPQAEASNDLAFGASRAPQLVVHRVGAFDASFVPSRADFERLDPRFRLADEIMQSLPYDDSWGYAVFKLHAVRAATGRGPIARLLARLGVQRRQPRQAQTQDIHPMAFVFETRKPNALFFPTIHVHRGHVPARASFDHQLYFQAEPADFRVPELELEASNAALVGPPRFAVDRSFGALGRGLDLARASDLIDGDHEGVRVSMIGIGPNRDVEIELVARTADR